MGKILSAKISHHTVGQYTYIWRGINQLFLAIFLYIAIAVFRAGFEQGPGPVLLNDMRCTGTESSLLSCSHRGIGVHLCTLSNDAGVVCPPCKSCIWVQIVLISELLLHVQWEWI